jgi:hypothetical protein
VHAADMAYLGPVPRVRQPSREAAVALRCRLRRLFAVLAEFVKRPNLRSSLSVLYSAVVWGTEPKEGKRNNQQDHPKSIVNYFQHQTHKTDPLSVHGTDHGANFLPTLHHARPFLDVAVTRITAPWIESAVARDQEIYSCLCLFQRQGSHGKVSRNLKGCNLALF